MLYPKSVRYAMSNRRLSISRLVVDHQFHILIFRVLTIFTTSNVCAVVSGDLFHIVTKGRRYFVFEMLSLSIPIAHCLLLSNIFIAV